jgi:hypothetical protein
MATQTHHTQTKKILAQAKCAKTESFDKPETAYKNLSGIELRDALCHVPDYLEAVAHIVAIEMEEIVGGLADIDAIVQEKRDMLMDYLRTAKTRRERNGEFLKNASRLIINVQKVWLALAQERPLHRLFIHTTDYPELVLPQAFGMRYYFNERPADPELVKIIRYAARIPDLAAGARPRAEVGEHPTFQ